MKALWKVISSIDGQPVFDWKAVMHEASIRQITYRAAAKRLAKENEDPETDERLIAVPNV